ncbi:hypothetical protein C7414_102421 [Cupriavidus alkaliphilus]|nr:hypothetical protein C7414_102421 [Cupriavidus alkaliphilus]
MAKCDACNSIIAHKRGEPGHDALLETGRDKYRPIGQPAIVTTSYTCSICGTKWTYENDKNDSLAGWHEVDS